MHFGPEWMRKAPSRANPSPPLATPTTTTASTYSALVAPISQLPPEKPDPANPFRYSKEDMIRIYKEGGGKSGLGLEVERWDGIVHEIASDPVGLKEMSEAEKKVSTRNHDMEMPALTAGRGRSLLARSTQRCAADLQPTTSRCQLLLLVSGPSLGIAPVRVQPVR
jgi:hypothetical protein